MFPPKPGAFRFSFRSIENPIQNTPIQIPEEPVSHVGVTAFA
jgi:hypothetical protein